MLMSNRLPCIGYFASIVLVSVPVAAQTNVFPGAGYVGIGTTSPNSPLHIRGPFVPGWTQFSIQASGADDRPGLSFMNGASERVGIMYWGPEGMIFGNDKGGPFRFFSGGAERLWVGGDGNVGVGTSAPATKLSVQGDEIRLTKTSNDALIRTQTTTAGAYFIADSATDGYFGTLYSQSGAGKWFLGSFGYADFSIVRGDFGSNSRYLTVSTGGNVGIGTTDPQARLDVQSAGSPALRVFDGGGDTSTIDFRRSSDGWHLGQIQLVHAGNYGSNLTFRLHPNDGTMPTAPREVMAIRADGNVGIGTSNPTQKLSVNGGIRAKEVTVDTVGWADYVFAEDYDLRPLSEVEQHIKAHKHLPGVPSASEVAAKGLGLGEMQTKLLAKIEELTLHQIDQEKRLKRLEDENKQLRALLPR